MYALRGLFARLSRAMPTRHEVLSEAELRSLSHEQLLAYALRHAPLSKTTPVPAKRATPEPELQEPAQIVNKKKKKRRKEFDMSRYGQRLVALHLVYTGWKFHGFSSQADSENTVEHHLFTALTKTRLVESRHVCDYSRSGRTDVGVSALGQVIGIRLRSNVTPPSTADKELDYVKVINGNLPEGIRVLAWTPVLDGSAPVPSTYAGDPQAIRTYWKAVDEGKVCIDRSNVRRPGEAFSARFDAIYRSYKYFFVRGALDVKAMQQAAKYFEGTHDFRNFCRIDENITNFERHMYTVDIRKTANDMPEGESIPDDSELAIYYIFVKGQAFLWHQVRCMAAVLFDVGMRREDPMLVKRMLDDAKSGTGSFANGKPHYRMASPTPLLLYECSYPASVVAFPQTFEREQGEDQVERNGDGFLPRTAFGKADASLSQSYATAATKTAVLEAMLHKNDNFASAPMSYGNDVHNKGISTFKSCRAGRNFLMDLNSGKHVPYTHRPCDDSLETKQERAAAKKKSKQKKL